MLGLLNKYALKCWEVFGLRGYAHVDFRVDANEKPWVLEINANPCLSSDAGFMAAAKQGGSRLMILYGEYYACKGGILAKNQKTNQ